VHNLRIKRPTQRSRDTMMYPHSPRLGSSPPSGKEVAECYRHATEARECAKHVNDPVLKQWFFDVERRWLSRVHGDEFVGRLTEITD
jgi:hypothetical protein